MSIFDLPAVARHGILAEAGAADAAAEDLEDLGTSFGAAKRVLARAVHALSQGAEGALEAGVREGAEVAGGRLPGQGGDGDEACPPRDQDYAGWLAHQKRRWLAQRDARKRRRADKPVPRKGGGPGDAGLLPLAGPMRDLGAFFRKQQHSAVHASWHILQVAETRDAGLFRVWALVNGSMYALRLRLPRTLYIDLEPAADPGTVLPFHARRVLRTLPHGHEAGTLYEAELEESEYRRASAALALDLADRDVRGVYESRLPLGLHAAWRLGCLAQLAPQARARELGSVFELGDLAPRTLPHEVAAYLEPAGGVTRLHQLSLYHCFSEATGRGLVALVLWPVGEAVLAVVSTAGARGQDLTVSGAERAWRDLERQRRAEAEAQGAEPASLPAMSFDVQYVGSLGQAFRALNRRLQAYREQPRGPTLVLCEGPRPSALIKQDLSLLDAFPCVDVPPSPSDSDLPPLGWQQRAMKAALAGAAGSREWLGERAQVARYAQLPVGNLGADWVLAAWDARFARHLRDQGHLLWAQDPSLPDLGRDSSADPAHVAPDVDWADPLGVEGGGVSISNPGAYRSVCVELRVHHLAVCALDRANLLGDLEGAALLDEASAGGAAFRALKAMVQRLLDDATKRGEARADVLLGHLARWIASPQSVLFDAGLQRAVGGLVRRLFLHLVAELKRLGATVVHADRGAIVLCTGKRAPRAAAAHVDYLLGALKRKELFSWLALVPHRWWHTMLWRDPFNFGGLDATAEAEGPTAAPALSGGDDVVVDNEVGPLGHALEDAEGEDEEDAAPEPELVFHWDLAEHLPPSLREYFTVLVSEFLVLPWKHARDALRERRGGGAGAGTGGTQAARDDRAAEAASAEHLAAAIEGHFTERLLKLAQEIQRHVPTASTDPQHRFPQRAGSHLTAAEVGEPALAFVKSVCHVFGLDAAVTDKVALLRKNLVQLLGVREFSAAASFADPSLPLVLRDVICPGCNDCRDMDLTRDPELQAGRWACRNPACGRPCDLGWVEARLLEAVGRVAASFQQQDQRCRTCKQVRMGHYSFQCRCGGDLFNDRPLGQYRKLLGVVRGIAATHKMATLEETVGFLLDG